MYGAYIFNPSTANGQNKAKVKSILIGEGANAKMSNLHILNNVNIGLNAVLTLANVDLKDVEQLQISHSKQSNRVSITGKIGSPPKSISLVEAESSLGKSKKLLLLEENLLTIVSAKRGDFPECEKWKNSIKIKGSAFDKAECIVVNATASGASLLNENDEIKLVAHYKSKDKSNAGLIAGVVIAVIVVLAIVGVVIFFVLRKKKTEKHSSDIDFAVNI